MNCCWDVELVVPVKPAIARRIDTVKPELPSSPTAAAASMFRTLSPKRGSAAASAAAAVAARPTSVAAVPALQCRAWRVKPLLMH